MFLYSAGRILFYLFNASMFPKVDFAAFVQIMRGGVMFDTSAVLYLNLLYFLLYLLPFPFKFQDWYQRMLKWIFMVFYDFWYIALILVITMLLLSKLYSFLKPRPTFNVRNWKYYLVSVVSIILFSALSVIGMRGGYMSSTRPISMNNAGKYVNSTEEMSLVLNTPFCILRTWGKKAFEVKNYFGSEEELNQIYTPVRVPKAVEPMKKDNVVVIILESFSRE